MNTYLDATPSTHAEQCGHAHKQRDDTKDDGLHSGGRHCSARVEYRCVDGGADEDEDVAHKERPREEVLHMQRVPASK